MKKIEKFEDLEVWKESMRLALSVYRNLESCHNFNLRDQMQRSAISVPSNIADGYDRNSNKEFIRFLNIAKGSFGELRTQLYLSKELDIIEKSLCNEFIENTRKISAMLYSLIQTRKEKF